MADDIAQWLEGLGLGQYAEAFAKNGIDLETLPHLREEDFVQLGVLLGHMRKLQAAIETLSIDEPSTRPAAFGDPNLSMTKTAGTSSCPHLTVYPSSM